jgi:hypothetical protein
MTKGQSFREGQDHDRPCTTIGRNVNINDFMQGYKAAWEGKDESMFATLFTPTLARSR